MLTEADKKYLTSLLNHINGSLKSDIYALSINKHCTGYHKEQKTLEYQQNIESREELIERINND